VTSSNIFEGISSLAQLVMALAVSVGVWVAYRQLEGWRKERQTIRKSEVAEEMIFIVSNIEDAFKNIRNPFDSIPVDKVDDKKFVYERRYQRITDANELFQRLREFQIRCDAVIGSEVTKPHVTALFNARTEVALAIEELSDLSEGSNDVGAAEELHRNRRILYGSWSDKDELGVKIMEAIGAIKSELSAYAQLSVTKGYS
jgi:hypothetical protein